MNNAVTEKKFMADANGKTYLLITPTTLTHSVQLQRIAQLFFAKNIAFVPEYPPFYPPVLNQSLITLQFTPSVIPF